MQTIASLLQCYYSQQKNDHTETQFTIPIKFYRGSDLKDFFHHASRQLLDSKPFPPQNFPAPNAL